ncbi:MAG: PEGA domain-containing protein [Nevskiales bacterium]
MKILIAALATVAISGCATIVKESTQDFRIESQPTGASIQIEDFEGNSVYQGTAPATASLERGAGYFKGARYKVTVSKDGYAPREFRIEPSINGWYIGGNIVFGGLIGWLAVDPATGAMWNLSPDVINAQMAAAGVSTHNEQQQLTIVLAENVPLDMWAHMQRLN